MVASASLEEIEELFEVVRVLDTFAALKAMKRLTGKDIDALQKMTNNLSVFYEKKKIYEYVKENLRFHERIWKTCGNKFLFQSLVNLSEKYTFYGNQVFFLTDNPDNPPSYLSCSYKDHVNLMKALKKRDVETVEKILISHWGKGFLKKEEE